MNTAAIVQARMGSTRLPGKVLKRLGERLVLEQVIFQLEHTKELNGVVVATSTEKEDDPIYDLCISKNWSVHRGDLKDVLDRYYGAASKFDVTTVVRITSDCPLIDPFVVDKVVRLYKSGSFAYASNINPPTFPDGLDCEVFSYEALSRARKDAKDPIEREHVTPYIRNHPELFPKANLTNDPDLSSYRWTLDREEDYQFLSKVVSKLANKREVITYQTVLEILKDNPELASINQHIVR